MDTLLENEKRFASAFLLYGITKVTVEFDGSGDSGQIDSIALYRGNEPVENEELPITVFCEPESVFNREKGEWTKGESTEKVIPLSDAIHNHVGIRLEQSGVDWHNNDGGHGSWEWDSKTGLEFSVYQRITTSECEHYEERQLGQEEGEPSK